MSNEEIKYKNKNINTLKKQKSKLKEAIIISIIIGGIGALITTLLQIPTFIKKHYLFLDYFSFFIISFLILSLCSILPIRFGTNKFTILILSLLSVGILMLIVYVLSEKLRLF